MGYTAKTIIEAVQTEFEKLIAEKNSWGKNELLLVIEKAKVNALLKLLGN